LFWYRIERIKTQKLIVERLVEERTMSLEKMTIDERKSRKAAEKAWKEAQNAHEALANIAFMQAHGIRRPLASIMGLINVIKSSGFECDPECLSNLEKACQELDEKIHSVLDQIEKRS
jgi:K+-sensing histidine kinase KdpD